MIPNPPPKPLDAPHRAHLDRIRMRFVADLEAKYTQGQREHGGNLWQKPGMIDEAIKEAIDLVVYLYTLKEQIEEGDHAL